MIRPRTTRHRASPRSGLRAFGWIVVTLVATLCLTVAVPQGDEPAFSARRPLHTTGVWVGADGSRVPLTDDDVPAQTPETLAWLAAGTVPGTGTRYEAMARQALLDLRALTLLTSDDTDAPRYAALAAWTPQWHYVWPRDAAFAAVAMAKTGHPTEAIGILRFLMDVQETDGTFRARYLADGSGQVPDSRTSQSDAVGWTLWAADLVLAELPAATSTRAQAELAPLIDRATAAALRLTAAGTRLPPPSSDYWEVHEYRLPLGVAAPMLMGLQAAGRLGSVTAQDSAARYRTILESTFGAQGYPRHRGWMGGLGATASDTATAFVRPPFVSAELSGARSAWLESIAAMQRPAGGLAPGGAWIQDGVSWTPTTSVYALSAAANGDVGLARQWLDWLDDHRTSAGSLPEKVLADGSPAAVAPLSWTSANVLITLAALDAL